jgi:hypothetical protein
MRDHWEYKMLVGSGGLSPHFKDADHGTDYGPTISTEMLNRFGRDGWEVCAFNISMADRTLMLKRKKD